jgi:hypothetical protein
MDRKDFIIVDYRFHGSPEHLLGRRSLQTRLHAAMSERGTGRRYIVTAECSSCPAPWGGSRWRTRASRRR